MCFPRSTLSAILAVLLLCCVGACGKPESEAIDAIARCEPARAVQCVVGPVRAQACTGEPIQVGTFCDEVFACVADEAAAQALVEVAAHFACEPGPGEFGMCDASQYSCYWETPGSIDSTEFEALCAITVLPAPPAQVVCIVYA
jgi:hypothetical protein